MSATFEYCVSLKNIDITIPDLVEDIRYVFAYCPSLRGNIQIDANLTGKINNNGEKDYFNCFFESVIENGISLKLTGNCTILDKIVQYTNNPQIHL